MRILKEFVAVEFYTKKDQFHIFVEFKGKEITLRDLILLASKDSDAYDIVKEIQRQAQSNNMSLKDYILSKFSKENNRFDITIRNNGMVQIDNTES